MFLDTAKVDHLHASWTPLMKQLIPFTNVISII